MSSGDAPDLSNLQESFSKQQAKINALKEMVKKSDHGTKTSSAHEMAKSIAEKLSNLKTKAKSRQTLNKSITDLQQALDVPDIALTVSTPPPPRRDSAGTPGSQKMELLKKQMEVNRQKLAERKNSKKELEETISQLRANFSNTQQSLEYSSELGRSMGDLSSLSYTPGKSKVKSTTDLSFAPLNLDKERIKFLENRIRHLEKQLEKGSSSTEDTEGLQKKIADLEESLENKENIQNDNQIQELLNEIQHLKTGDNIEIEDLRYQLEEKIKEIEVLRKSDNQSDDTDILKSQLDLKDREIEELRKMKEKIQVQAVTTIFDDEMEQQLREEMEELKQKLQESSGGNEELSKEIKELKEVNDMLETLRCDLKVKNSELEDKIAQMEEGQKFEIVTKEEVETNQIGDEFMAKIRELETKITILEQENEELKGNQNLSQISDENAADAIKEMDSSLDQYKQKIQSLEDQLAEKMIECNVLNANFSVLEEKLKSTSTPKTLFPSADEASEAEITKLKSQLDEVNKSMIKMKVKSKQQQKQIDNFKKMSSANEEISKLNEEIEKLQSKIKDLESSQIESIDIDEVEINNLKEKVAQLTLENADLHHKLSDKASSSAFNKGLDKPPEIGEELNESLVKLREESSELNERIELFASERRDLLEKMDALTIENSGNIKKINVLISEKAEVEVKCLEYSERISYLKEKLQQTVDEKDAISLELKSVLEEKRKIQDELNVLKRESKIKPSDDWKALVQQAETHLPALTTEIENFSKAKDKKSSAKKFVKEVRNIHQQFSNVLEKIKRDLERGSETDDEIENLKEKIDMLSREVEERQGYAKVIEELKEEIQNLRSQEQKQSEDHASQVSSLQSELEALRSQEPQVNEEEVQELKNKIQFLQSELDDLRNQPVENHDEELQQLRDEITQLTEIETTLKSEIQSLEDLINDKESSHERQIENLTRFKMELEARFETAEQEIQILKDLNSEQKQQLIESLEDRDTKEVLIEGLEMQLKKAHETNDQSKKTEDSQSEVMKLQQALNINKGLLAEQVNEQANKQATIDTLNAQIIDLYKTMEENANKVLEKDDEIAYIQELFDANKAELERFAAENKKLTQELHSQKLTLEQFPGLKEDSLKQEEKIQNLYKDIAALEQKNKDQMDKMKKYAVNLKKKNLQCADLEQKLKGSDKIASLASQEPLISSSEFEQLQANNSHLERENNLLNEEISRLSQQVSILNSRSDEHKMSFDQMSQEISSLQKHKINSEEMLSRMSSGLDGLRSQIDACHHELKEKENSIQQQTEEIKAGKIKVEKCKAIIKEKNAQLQRLKDSSVSSQGDSEVSKNYQALLEEKKVFQETISKLETLHHGIQAKLEEDMSYIETLENENANYKDKIYRLEECIATFEERRSSMERKVNLLDCQLQSKTDEFQKNEDQLVYRLNMLSDHDEVIAQRLLDCQEEKEDLSEKLHKLKQEHSELVLKHNKLEKDVKSKEVEMSDNESLETENQSLREQLAKVEVDMNKIRAACKNKLAKSRAEMEDLENELTEQVRIIEEEKRALKEQLERSQDASTELKDDIVRLNETVSSLEQSKTELERDITWTRMQNDNMSQDQLEIQELRMQVMHEKTENENLKRQIESLIQNHDYEMNGLRTQISELDALRAQVGQNQTDDQQAILSENKRLKDLLKDRDLVIENYQRQNLQLQMNSFMGAAQPQDPFASLSSTSQPDDSMEIESLREKVRQLEEDKTRLEAAVQSDNSLEVSGLKRAIQSLEESLAAANSEKTALQEDLEDQLKLLMATNEQLRLDIDKLQNDELVKARQEYQKLYDEMQKIRQEREQFKVDILNKDLKIQNLTRQVEENPGLQEQLDALIIERDQARQEAHRLLADNEHSNIREAMLTDELEAFRRGSHRQELDQRNQELQMMSVEMNNIRQEALNALRDRDLVQESLTQRINEISELKLRVDQLTAELMETSSYKELLKQKDEELQAGRKEIDVIVEKNKKLESQLIQICSENSEMSEKLKMFESQVSNFHEKIKSTFGEMQNLQTVYEEKLREKCQENERLLEEVNKLMAGNNEMQHQLLASQQEIGYLNSRIEEVHAVPPVNPIMTAFGVAPSSSPFDEIVPVKKVTFAESAAPSSHSSNSHLEKKIQELEQQLQSLTILNQETIRQMNESERQYEHLLNQAEDKVKALEIKLRDLECEKNVEAMIVPSEATVPVLSSFFGQEASGAQFLPEITDSVEPLVVAKKAYLCGPENQDETALNLDLGDDWSGWAGEETAQKVTTVQSLLSPQSHMQIKLQEQEERIAELTLERDRLEEQKQELQSKSGKLMKKLKEYKTKIDEISTQSFRKSSSVESNELDLAIQEELRSQVKQLEEKLEELKKSSEKEGIEKESLNKKLDVLTSANDRMVEMKERQDSEVQMYKSQIRDLNDKLNTMGNWGEQVTPVRTVEDHGPPEEWVKRVNELNTDLNDLRIEKDELQAMLEESNNNMKESEQKVKLLQEKLIASEQSTNSEVSKMESESNEVKSANQKLRETIAELEESLSVLRASKSQSESKLEEIKANNANVEALKKEIAKLKEDHDKLVNQNNSEQLIKQKESEMEHLKAQWLEKLQEKEAEIDHLNHRCEELQHEDQTAKLVLEILAKNQEIHILKMQNKNLEEEKTELEHNLTLQISQEIESKKQVIETVDSGRISYLEKLVNDLKEEKSSMEEELKVLNDHVMNALGVEDKLKQLETVMKMKEMEISDLKIRLAQPKPAGDTNTEQLNAYWETIVEEKCAEIANSWRTHLEQREEDFKKHLESCSKTEDVAVTTNDGQLLEALQNQEMEIVTLKEQLAIRSAEYASLAARYDPYQEKGLSSPDAKRRSASTGDSNVVPKSELDLAMYMLHQRDMRCEELTLELSHLLEERDTLQLKLSNTIRQVEEIKDRIGLTSDQISLEPVPQVDQAAAIIVPEGEGVESSPTKRDDNLKDKLSQLQYMNYNRDKNFKEERDERIRQMERIQQDVANIPQQAVSQLVGTDLSQTSQSPSSVLLNWLWGKPSTSDQQS
ncbi:lva family protein [Megaselia abdita]